MNDRSYRGGAQVHAVPDDERALDSSGRPLPWGYAYADSSLNRKQPVERGAFGKATNRRSSSRSKTATPGTRDDRIREENQKVQDAIFGKFKVQMEEKASSKQGAPGTRDSTVARMHSTTDLTTTAPISGSATTKTAPSARVSETFAEPSEILIHGYLPSHQPTALHFYETASLGLIYEDYDRSPTTSYTAASLLSRTTTRTRTPKDLPVEALRRINTYRGGDHWIKVTLESPAAAQRAISASPHVIGGCEVYAALWTGSGPANDVALPAGGSGGRSAGTIASGRNAGGQRASREWSSLPGRVGSTPALGRRESQHDDTGNGAQAGFGDSTDSTSTLGGSSSATANGNGNGASSNSTSTATAWDSPSNSTATEASSATMTQRQRYTNSTPQQQIQEQPPRRTPKIRNATLVPLHPASAALLPTVPWSVRTFGSVPLLGSLVISSSGHQAPAVAQSGAGGNKGFIGATIPRDEKGGFDWASASFWWVFCWYLDWLFGSDLCGLRGEE